MELTTYSYRNVAVSLDKRPVIGVWEGDDCVTIARRTDLSTMLVGADGKPIVSYSADESAEITLRLQHTSTTHQRLLDFVREQRVSRRPRIFPFAVRDTQSQEGGAAEECIILQSPTMQHGINASMREWRLAAGMFIWNQVSYE